ncbi:MAG: GxxExxY protein [Thermomicrobiales bacterium]
MDAVAQVEPGEIADFWASEVIGAAIEVHRRLGPGFLESVYEEALAIEFDLRQIPYARQAAVGVNYKGYMIGEGRVDLLVADILVVELKTVESLSALHVAQVISYLKATRLHLGLLLNFHVPVLKQGVQRVIYSLK